MGVRVMDRCNLTVIETPGQEDLPEFLAAEQVEIVASLPCYLEDNVDRQRGRGVFEASLRALRRLNALGYGREASGLMLNLVYNPQGTALPPPQDALEADYKRVLREHHGIAFNRLYTMANMPIQRFGAILIAKGEFERYLDLLQQAHLDANLDQVMCRRLISVDWRGYVYDCDFNQMLDLPLASPPRRPQAKATRRAGGRETRRVHLSDLVGADLELRRRAEGSGRVIPGIASAAAGDQPALGAGRMCPADYRYPPSVFARPPDFAADALYVVGGLYGNLAALDAVERLAAREGATLVFNGDFHWFDAAPDWFTAIERGVTRHRATRGNVETEIARVHDVGAGCGCAYPASVAEDAVRRSNEMLQALRDTAAALPDAAARLAALPMHLVVGVGALRVAVVHGDATSLAGWSFAPDRLDRPDMRDLLTSMRRAAQVDVFASTHTCLAALRDFELRAGRLTIVNNGAAGMPNFAGSRFGLISRIGTTPSPHRPLYGLVRDGAHIDAIPVHYDGEAFLRRFRARWPEGSAAHASYHVRIMGGAEQAVAQAWPGPRGARP
jgi:hypothetical protein